MDNWERNRIISEAAKRILAGADPAILKMKRSQQAQATLALRRKLQAETGCSLDTTIRHINLSLVLRSLRGEK